MMRTLEVRMQAVKVLPKWQITIPKRVREKLKIHVGDTVVVEEREGEIRKAISKVNYEKNYSNVCSICGSIRYPG